jgi:aspartate aminotransferase
VSAKKYDIQVAKRVRELQPSATLAIDAKAKKMISQGIDVVNLGAGEPDFPTPEPLRKAAIDAIHAGFTKYTPVQGTLELRAAIAFALERDQNLTYEPETQILVSAGAKHSIYNVCLSLLDPGDEVIIPAPYWVSYPDIVGLAGAEPVIVESTPEKGFVPDPDDVEEAITDDTKMIILNSPGNPTGLGYPKEFMAEMVRIAVENGVFLLSDEIYRDIVYDGFRCVSPAEISEEGKIHTILVNGASKTYAMTGWRIGYTAALPEIIAAMNKLQGQSTSNPSSISQAAASAAFKAPRELVTGMVAEFAKRMNYVVAGLNAIPGVKCPRPRGAFYVFPDMSSYFGKRHENRVIDGSSGIAEYLLEVGRVAAVPGAPFGAPKHVRISFANSMANLERAIARIGEALGKLK